MGPRFCDSITLYISEGSQYKAKKEKYSLHVNIRNQHTHIMSANFGIKDTASEMCTFFSNKLERIINLDTLYFRNPEKTWENGEDQSIKEYVSLTEGGYEHTNPLWSIIDNDITLYILAGEPIDENKRTAIYFEQITLVPDDEIFSPRSSTNNKNPNQKYNSAWISIPKAVKKPKEICKNEKKQTEKIDETFQNQLKNWISNSTPFLPSISEKRILAQEASQKTDILPKTFHIFIKREICPQ